MICLLAALAFAAEPPPSLSLRDTLKLAVERNPDRTSAQLAEEIAAISARRARINRVTAEIATNAGVGAEVIRPWGGPTTSATSAPWSATASASVPLYAGGAISASIDSADAGARIGTVDREITERNLVRAAYTAYWNIKGYEAQIEAAEEGLALTQQSLDIIVAKADAGLAAGIDVNRSNVEVLSQQDNLIAQKLGLYQADQELLRLLNLPGDDLVLTDEPPAPKPGDVSLPGDAGSKRPELARKRLEAAQADAAIRSARSAILPYVGVSATAGVAGSPLGASLGDKLLPTMNAGIGVQATWNPFDLFITRDRVAQAKLAARQVEASTIGETIRIQAEIREAAASVEALRARAPLVDGRVTLARDNLTIVQSLYGQGSASLLDLFNAQSSFRAARTQGVALRVQLVIAEEDLRWLLGEDVTAGVSP